MKRWAIRLSAVTAVVALGWFTVAWAQRQPDEQTPPPNFSKPVNAGAFAQSPADNPAMSGSNTTPVSVTPDAPGTKPIDPFQSASTKANDRYQIAEPNKFDPDPNAGALATDTSEIATKQVAHNAAPAGQNDPYNRYPVVQDTTGGAATAGNQTAGNQFAGAGNDSVKPHDPFTSTPAGAKTNSDAGTVGQMQTPAASGVDQARAADGQYGGYGQGSGAGASAGDFGPAYGAAAIATKAAGNGANNSALEAAPQSGFGGDSPAPPAPSGRGAAGYSNSSPRMDNRPPVSLENMPGATNGNANDLWKNDGTPPQSAANSGRDGNLFPPPKNQNGMSAAVDPYGTSGRNMQAAAQGDVYGAPSTPPVNVEGFGRPGDKKLEGAQTPSVTIQKIAPPEIKVGKAAKFEIIVRNTGPVVAENVEVIESVPQGTTLVGTTPQTQTGQRGEILWRVGELKPAEEAKLQIELMPVAEGEIGSVAVVQFRSQASMRTIATKPELVLELNAPKQVMIGTEVTVGIKISNPGTGAAEKIVLHEAVPQGFQHPAGGELEFEVGTLKPGETRNLDLTLRAVQAGTFPNLITVSGEGNLRDEKNAPIQVISPALEVAIEGPGLRYLERQAKYSVSVSNPGTAPAKNVELVTRLPKGMQFVEASDMGHYDKSSHSVIWSLAELPALQAGTVTLTTLASEPGEQKLRGEGRAAGGLSHTIEQTTIVEGVAAVLFSVVDVDDPIEVGGQVTYEIKVVNQGSKAATQVLVGAVLPPQMKPVSAEGPAQYRIDRDRVIFEPMARLAPKADVTYRIVAQAISPGNSRIQVRLRTDEITEEVTKEESTRVYKD